MIWSCSATSCFESLKQMKPKNRTVFFESGKLFLAKFSYTVCTMGCAAKILGKCIILHQFFFYSRRIPHRTMACKLLKMKALFFLFKKTILVKRVMQIHLVPLIIPLNSWMRHRLSQLWSTLQYVGSPLLHAVSVVRRQAQKCFLFDAPFWRYCVVVRCSQKNRDLSNATRWTRLISTRLLWTPCYFKPKRTFLEVPLPFQSLIINYFDLGYCKFFAISNWSLSSQRQHYVLSQVP